MATPNFDFSHSESRDTPRRFAPLREAKEQDLGWLGYAFAGLFLGIAVVVIISRIYQRRERARREKDRWKKLHEIAVENGLSADEERVLEASLREAKANTPERVLSENYYNTMVGAIVKRRIGGAAAERLRKKLFQTSEVEETGAFGGTHELAAGQKLRLHFAGSSGTFTCTVINISEHSFVVTLPVSGSRHVQPRKNDSVEGFMERGNALFAFESRVQETFMGGVFACRIAHTNKIKQTRERQASRATLTRRVVFGHFAANDIGGGQVNMAALQDQLTDRWEGMVRDISVGGCSIATPAQHNFQVGDFVQFALSLLEDEPPHTVLGTIVHITPVSSDDGGGRILHLQFLGLDEEAQGSITRAVHRLSGEED